MNATTTITFECWGQELTMDIDPDSANKTTITSYNEADPIQDALHKIFCSRGTFIHPRADGTMGEFWYPQCCAQDRCFYQGPYFNLASYLEALDPRVKEEDFTEASMEEEEESLASKINTALAKWNEFYAKKQQAIELFSKTQMETDSSD